MDALAGSQIVQLTTEPVVHDNIYCEVPYTDPTSRYVMYLRTAEEGGPSEVGRADLELMRLDFVCDRVPGAAGIAVSFDQRFLYCLRNWRDARHSERSDESPQVILRYAQDDNKNSFELTRVDIATLAQQATRFENLPSELHSLGAIAPDGRRYYASARLGPHRYGILRFDLETGTFDVIHERGDDLCNAHTQIEPGKGRDLLIQHNRGAEVDDEGNVKRLVGEEGATLYLIDTDGGNLRTLPVGKPYTAPCQGHQSWIGDTGEIVLTVTAQSPEQAAEEGNLLVLRPGDEAARVAARGYYYCHPNASKDGRFFVSDTQPEALIVVGSLTTGQTRVLCASGASFGGPQHTHPHPYLTPDCNWVIFNSDRSGAPHVHAARLPEGLREELEGT